VKERGAVVVVVVFFFFFLIIIIKIICWEVIVDGALKYGNFYGFFFCNFFFLYFIFYFFILGKEPLIRHWVLVF
jgi:hypothetical protein